MKYIKYLLISGFVLLTACLQEELLVVTANFSLSETPITNGKKAIISNLSVNGDVFKWTFENGTPSSSDKFNPGEVVFTSPGTHKIKLIVSNKDGSVAEMEKTITVTATATTNFSYEVLINNYAPAEVVLTNLSQNVTQNNWTFTNGNPATSAVQNPGNVVFNTAGQNSITLQTNQSVKILTFNVLPALNVDFNIIVPTIDDDYNAPVKLKMQNTTISATSYIWEVLGATPINSIQENPEFFLPTSGVYQIKLTATNGKQTLSKIKSFNVLPYTNLSLQNNIKLGINTAQNTLGVCYATQNKAVYKNSEINATNGSAIDVVFYGFNSNFANNFFVSPANASNVGLPSIPNATTTVYNNKQEVCGCNAITVAQFDNLTTDTFLQTYNITNITTDFNNSTLPRIVPFVTQSGKKGLIKINSFVADGANSYILVDIKVQKH